MKIVLIQGIMLHIFNEDGQLYNDIVKSTRYATYEFHENTTYNVKFENVGDKIQVSLKKYRINTIMRIKIYNMHRPVSMSRSKFIKMLK